MAVLDAVKSNGGPLACPEEPHHTYSNNGSGTTLAVALTIGGVVICSSACVVLFLFWRRNKIRQAYRWAPGGGLMETVSGDVVERGPVGSVCWLLLYVAVCGEGGG